MMQMFYILARTYWKKLDSNASAIFDFLRQRYAFIS